MSRVPWPRNVAWTARSKSKSETSSSRMTSSTTASRTPTRATFCRAGGVAVGEGDDRARLCPAVRRRPDVDMRLFGQLRPQRGELRGEARRFQLRVGPAVKADRHRGAGGAHVSLRRDDVAQRTD